MFKCFDFITFIIVLLLGWGMCNKEQNCLADWSDFFSLKRLRRH